MTTLQTWIIAVQGLRSNLGRSLLTILGIVIGIVAIVVVISLGRAARVFIIDQVEGIGAHTLIIRPGRQPQGPTDVAESILSDSLKQKDVDALRNPGRIPGVISVEPAILVPGGAVSYQSELYRPFVLGWTASALVDFFGIEPIDGAMFTEEDIRQRAKVAVIGSRVKDELFGESNAVGETVKLKGQTLRIVGVLPQKGQVSVLNLDEMMLLPYSTAQKDILGINHFHELFVSVDDTTDVKIAAEDIEQTLRDLHGITDPEKDDFFVLTQQDIVERISVVTQALTIFLVAIASISLLVGGVGIMNIMLVSVTERTQEIGLRKALGATNKNISSQFLFEALILTVSGGLVGVLLAWIITFVIAFVVRTYFGLAWSFQMPLFAIVLGVGMAGLVGVVFGIYPSKKASRKNPIEALRYE